MEFKELRDYQKNIVRTAINHFIDNDKAILNMCCGTGKTITSLFIAKKMMAKKLLILVPNNILAYQWFNIVKLLFPTNIIIMYKKKLINYDILISTYHNSKKIRDLELEFDLTILDECHHLTGLLSNNNCFLHSLKINTIKQISLTATLKKIKSNNPFIIDNYSVEYFGDIIANIPIDWSINNNIICDFDIQILTVNDDIFFKNINISNNKLYFSAYVALYNIYHNISNNVLIFANKIKNIDEIIIYINMLLTNKIFNLPKINIIKCTSDYKYDISSLKTNNNNNILCSVYSLGEGYDLPMLDTVIFSENMTSSIRIIQSLLRPCRRHKNKKKALVVLPIICNNFVAYNDEFQKIKTIIYSISDNINDLSISTYLYNKIQCDSIALDDNNIIINRNIINTNKLLKNIYMSKNDFKSYKYNKYQNFLDNNKLFTSSFFGVG